jgi:hypothetical protein
MSAYDGQSLEEMVHEDIRKTYPSLNLNVGYEEIVNHFWSFRLDKNINSLYYPTTNKPQRTTI